MAQYPNGRIPASVLARVRFSPGDLLEREAEASLARMNEAWRKRFGRDLTINEGYRSREVQDDYYARSQRLVTHNGRLVRRCDLPVGHSLRFVASKPGTSVHGFGLAVDFGDLVGFGSNGSAWLRTYAGAFGWWQPPQYRQGGRWPEFWHWEYRRTHDTKRGQQVAPEQEDEPMPKFDEVPKITKAAQEALGGPQSWEKLEGYAGAGGFVALKTLPRVERSLEVLTAQNAGLVRAVEQLAAGKGIDTGDIAKVTRTAAREGALAGAGELIAQVREELATMDGVDEDRVVDTLVRTLGERLLTAPDPDPNA